MKNLCVFCGSNVGNKTAYVKAAMELAECLVNNNIGLVYGGASVGLMGRLADSVLLAGGEVIGVIPQSLVERELVHQDLTDLRIVDSMQARKALMDELSDGFVALPGGMGTLDELFEVLTWLQLGFHNKPCGLLNVAGYFDGLLSFLDHATAEKFIKPEHRAMVIVEETPSKLIAAIAKS